MSGAVGTGNIGGVALAIWTGGPAAIFWMWITAIFGMTTKFVEVTMGHKYRTKLDDGSISGGPMYYIEHALNMKWAGILFAFLMMITAIGSGNMPQINNIALVMNTEFSVPKLFTGLFLGALLWVIIIGGIKRIASVASKIIPIMGLIYFGGALIILIENYQNIIPSFNAIFSQVFTGSAAVGGFLGASFAMSLKYGVARGLYSNEAGQGSSPIAHASSKNTSIDQGVVSILEPFIDTIVVCSVTALVILSSGVWTEKFDTTFSKTDMVILEGIYSDQENIDGTYIYPDHMNQLTRYVQSIESDVNEFSGIINIEDGKLLNTNITVLHSRSIAENVVVKNNSDKNLYSGSLNVLNGKVIEPVLIEGKSLVSSAELTAKAFSQGTFGDYGGKLVAIALLLFAFSTAITWCYYGDRSTAYIFGERGVFWYRNFYVLCFILAAVIDTTIVWNIAYVVVALVSIPNLIALFVLRNEMKNLTNEFIKEN
jgi:AGCS family alanine or glycine:cation symporter